MHRIARLRILLSTLFIAAFIAVSGAVILGGGYWLSDLVYDAGLWPIGAAMRVILVVMLIGFVIGFIAMVLTGLGQLFSSDEVY